MRTSAFFTNFVVSGAILAGLAMPARGQVATTLSEQALLDLNQDWSLRHQGSPMGVPKDYKWATNAYMEAGNQPGKFTALTGWGHVFWDKETIGHPGPLEIRNFHTFICSGSDERWTHVSAGPHRGRRIPSRLSRQRCKKAGQV